jgi:hypothetical protein
MEWSNNINGGRERAKHIDIRKYFAHEAIQNGHLHLIRVATTQQLADIFTKSIHPGQWEACLQSIRSGSGYLRQGRRFSRVEWSQELKSSHVGPCEG